ncbi:MAG: hypothetical protein AAF850_13795 [Pseudomonadota bacterium]
MQFFDYAVRQMAGVWIMAIASIDGDQRRWRDRLDLSVDGVFRSFWAVAFAAPFAIIGAVALRRASVSVPDLQDTPFVAAPLAIALTARIGGLIAYWAAGIGLIILTARATGRSQRVAETIIAFNWAQVFAFVLQAGPVAALGFAHDPSAAGAVAIPVLIIVLTLFWGVFRKGLEASVILALMLLGALVALDLGVDFFATAFIRFVT